MPSDHDSLESLTAFAMELADIGAAVCMEHFRQPLDVESKPDNSPVTIADRGAEAAMRKRISEKYPAHGIHGEEHGADNSDAEHTWVIDPIDGTKSFISGMPTFGTLIAYLENQIPKIGIINVPALNERWLKARPLR